jgi:zinc transport system ATP-binding protein
MNPLLTVSDLRVVLDNQLILDEVTFDLDRKETLAVIGPNGAGKTTLFRALLGLIPFSGKVTWRKGVKIGYVPQRLFIERDFPLTVREFFSLRGSNISSDEVERTLGVVGFEDLGLLDKKVGVLSGGEMQRVLIAWALCNRPDVLLFDEPTSGVDVSAEMSIYALLNKIHKEEDLAIVLISHELEIVDKYATKVICLNKRKVCYGSPKEVFQNESIAELFGEDISLYHHH